MLSQFTIIKKKIKFYDYICAMVPKKLILEEMWSRQQISSLDVNYGLWEQKRKAIQQTSRLNQSCIFTVDVFRNRYDYASERFSEIFGFNSSWLKNIQNHGDLLEDRIHPTDRDKITEIQIKHGQFIYSLAPEERNSFRNIFQFRMLNTKGRYINVISRQQVLETDRNGKAWIIIGMMDISPDQILNEDIKYSSFNIKTGDIISDLIFPDSDITLTDREKEILNMICQGLLSKEIAGRLNLSIHTINNHRKNILLKLKVDNSIEAINKARSHRLID